MKKFLTVALMVVMIMSLTLAVSAEVGGFIQSPSNNPAPEIINGENVDDDCNAQIIITAYIDRDELHEEKRLKLEEAYRIIAENPDLSKLNEKLIEMAEALGIAVTDLAVSDMFDISATDCDTHDGHGHFDITLKADTLEHFVCLLHYFNDEWSIVEGAEVTHEGTHLEFDADEFSPFAIVVNTDVEDEAEPEETVADTADTTAAEETAEAEEAKSKKKLLLSMAMIDISGLALIGLAITYKKSKS